jgi:hypothetical protein
MTPLKHTKRPLLTTPADAAALTGGGAVIASAAPSAAADARAARLPDSNM